MKRLWYEYPYGLLSKIATKELRRHKQLDIQLFYYLQYKLDDVDEDILELGEIITAELEDERSF